MLKLTKPIAFFDLETTGIDRENDRIVQIAIYRLLPDFTIGGVHKWLVNPEIPIPAASTEIHKITDDMVKDEPTFYELAPIVFSLVNGCDLGGFNSNYFDVPILVRQLGECGLFLDHTKVNLIDVNNIFKIHEPRNLANAVRFYLGREMQAGAHDAEVDVVETVNVFMAMIAGYEDLPDTAEGLAIFSNYNKKMADLSGKFIYDDAGNIVIDFGSKKGQKASDCMDYISWMYYRAATPFPADTRAICEQLLGITKAQEESDELPW